VRGVLRNGADHGLRFAHSSGTFRAVGRRLTGEIRITIASPADLVYVQSRLTPGLPPIPPSPDPLITHLVGIRHGRVRGFVELVRHPSEEKPYVRYWLSSLIVLDPLCRGRGIGEALACRVMEIARGEEAGELWLVVGETNRPAVALYQKLGFERAVVEDLEEQLGEEAKTAGKRSITMVKRLHE